MTLLEARNLGVRRGDRWVLRDVGFRLEAGSSLGVVGESGAGKSTLMGLLLALLEPDAGEVLLEGQAWSSLSERQRRPRRPRLQAVFQDPLASLPPHLTGWEILQEPWVVHRRGDAAARRTAAAQMAERVRFPVASLSQKPAQWSGGLGQRLAIGRALMLDPQLLVLDEPLSALDPTLAQHVLELLLELPAEGRSLVFVSHDLAAVARLCDQVLVLYDGQSVAQGPTSEVLGSRSHPYVRGLWDARPELDGTGARRWGLQDGSFALDGGCPLRGRCPQASDVCGTPPPWRGAVRCHHPLPPVMTVTG